MDSTKEETASSSSEDEFNSSEYYVQEKEDVTGDDGNGLLKIDTWQTWNTGYNADSAEWCPVKNYVHVFVCGTYQLEKDSETDDKAITSATRRSSTQKRNGTIHLLSIDFGTKRFSLMQTLQTNAILDMKWCHKPIKGLPYLGIVDALGFLQLYKLMKSQDTEDDEILKLELITKFKISEESKSLALSLDWNTGKHSFEEPGIVVSDSAGNVSVLQLNEDDTISKVDAWKCHDYEAWICAFNYWNPSVIFTGGDDCLFKSFDLRCGTEPTMLSRKHEAGVTSLHCNWIYEHTLASGSYDETLRIWDLRKMRSPVSDIKLGGGIWRLKWEPIKSVTLLAACMYGGFSIVNYDSRSTLKIVAEYNEHKSIAYGADWCHKKSQYVRKSIVTCSFYDCKMDVSEIKLKL